MASLNNPNFSFFSAFFRLVFLSNKLFCTFNGFACFFFLFLAPFPCRGHRTHHNRTPPLIEYYFHCFHSFVFLWTLLSYIKLSVFYTKWGPFPHLLWLIWCSFKATGIILKTQHQNAIKWADGGIIMINLSFNVLTYNMNGHSHT